MGRLRLREPVALAVLAVGAVALIVAVATARPAPAELAALRLPEPQAPILPDPGYQTGFPEVSVARGGRRARAGARAARALQDAERGRGRGRAARSGVFDGLAAALRRATLPPRPTRRPSTPGSARGRRGSTTATATRARSPGRAATGAV